MTEMQQGASRATTPPRNAASSVVPNRTSPTTAVLSRVCAHERPPVCNPVDGAGSAYYLRYAYVDSNAWIGMVAMSGNESQGARRTVRRNRAGPGGRVRGFGDLEAVIVD